ncbi:MAG: cupin domain-containing protein [Candidatus Pacebacteria bacterium]|nr:cupin domain-containing protein [Candidatus Paceibacterota bacterium]
MKPYVQNIEQETLSNDNFRKEVFTGEHLQMTVMSIPVGGDIGLETHAHTDQFLRVEQGAGKAILDGVEYEVSDDFAIIIPAGTEHNIVNTGDVPMKLYSIYTPPEHPAGTIDKTQADAMAREKAE